MTTKAIDESAARAAALRLLRETGVIDELDAAVVIDPELGVVDIDWCVVRGLLGRLSEPGRSHAQFAAAVGEVASTANGAAIVEAVLAMFTEP